MTGSTANATAVNNQGFKNLTYNGAFTLDVKFSVKMKI